MSSLWSRAYAPSALVCMLAFGGTAHAQEVSFDIPGGDMGAAVRVYVQQSGVQLVYKVEDLRGIIAKPLKGNFSAAQALRELLSGVPLQVRQESANTFAIIRDGGQANGAKTDSPIVIEKIMVSAQKRDEDAQQVPISLTTLSAATIDKFRIANLQDVSRLTPGLLVSSFSYSNPTIAIRGASNTFNQIGVNKPVAVVVDDVFIPRSSAATFELFDLNDVTVLKGPQGTLFGRNVTGGAIVINTRKPAYDKSEYEAQLTVGNLGASQVSAYGSMMLGSDTALKISGSVKSRDGYGLDRLTGKSQDDIDSQNVRAQLRVGLSANVEANVSVDYSEDRNGGRTLSSNTLGDDGNRRTSELGVNQLFDRAIKGVSARINWIVGGGEINAISAYRQSSAVEEYSGVGTNFAFLTTGSQSITRDADQVKTFSQEIRYASPKWNAGDFVAGIYFLDENGKRQLANRGLAARTGGVTASTLAEQEVDTRSYSFFMDGVWRALPSLDVVAGVRYNRDKKIADLVRTDFAQPRNSFTATDLSATWSDITPRLALNWRASGNAILYASATRGFTSGGFNTDASSIRALTTPFNPETVTNYELGGKAEWLQNRLRTNISLFRMNYKNKQELVNNSLTGILTITNASEATIKGADVEVAYQPTSVLGFTANYGRLDSKYDRFAVGTINFSGNPLASSPRNKYSLASTVRYPLDTIGVVTGAVSYAWIDQYNTGAANDSNLMIPGYALVNLSLGWESRDRRWRVQAWAKNLNNTSYILTRSTQVVRGEYLGEPRTYGLTITAKL